MLNPATYRGQFPLSYNETGEPLADTKYFASGLGFETFFITNLSVFDLVFEVLGVAQRLS